MQQYRNPYDHEAKAEQLARDPGRNVSEDPMNQEEQEAASTVMSGDRTIEIVEQNDAGTQEANNAQQEQEAVKRTEQPADNATDHSEQEQAEDTQENGAAADGNDDASGNGETQLNGEPPFDAFEGDAQYTGPLFGGGAAADTSAEVEAVKAEMENLRLRQAADMDNFKKRLVREHQEQMQYAAEKVLSDLLPTLDNLELALQYGNTNEVCKDLLQGVSMTHKLLLDAVQKHGLKPVGEVGEPFDPSIHEAVGFDANSDQEKGAVARVLQRGYKLGNRLLRAARVMVSQPAEG